MRTTLATLSAFFLGLTLAASGAPIPINGYDINDAVISGHGNWSHTYSGIITPGASFTNGGFSGVTATYSGVGTGTLTDGIIGNSIGNSQLFVTPQATVPTSGGVIPISPSIILTLPFAYTVNTIEIFGGDIPSNGIPGAITGVTVGLLDNNFNFHQHTFATVAFGTVLSSIGVPVNDRITLAGSPLEGIPAFAVFLESFQGNVSNWISITEITLDGELYPEPNPGAVPEPGTLGLSALALAGLWLLRRKR